MMMKSIALAVLMLALGAGTAGAQILKYVDTAGVAHYVGSEAQIPEQYRAGAKEPKLPKASRVGNQTNRSPAHATQQQAQTMKGAEAAGGAVDDKAPEVADTEDAPKPNEE